MSGFDKIIKGACKPKPAPPKAKYLDPILAATWSEDGAVGDLCKALSPKIKEPNAVVVFKALIVLHTMIRNGATDNVLAYLSNTDVLRLRNVGGGHWEGYNAPANLQHYAIYLDSRIRAFRETKHDAIRVQSETNRDHRLSEALDEDERLHRYRKEQKERTAKASESAPVSRSKTVVGRKLRVMTVEKGLLRETRAVQKQIDALVECRFYLDDLEDELTITALRMCVKDLVILFQAGNEGMVNVLEHFFEMSHVDAEMALGLYRHFCKQTERVVEYLGVGKKLQNLLNVPIPNMRHAPVSLAGALEEYLADPNFEQNRIEYKTQKDAADKNAKAGIKGVVKKEDTSPEPSSSSTVPASSSTSSNETAKPDSKQAVMDFFTAIEEEQHTMFNPQTGSPTTTYFQQQATYNPFAQLQQSQMTGAFPNQPFMQQPPAQVQPQHTSFIQPQHTSFQVPHNTNPFGLQQQATGVPNFMQAQPQQPQATGMPNFMQAQQQQPQATGMSNFMQPQQTGFLQPQATGANPFRQSMLAPQATGMAAFGGMGGMPSSSNGSPFQVPSSPGLSGSTSAASTTSTFSSASSSFPAFTSPAAQQPMQTGLNASNVPARPATAPLKASSPPPQPVKSHQTGSRNPFGVPQQPAPPVPKIPTMFELMMGVQTGTNNAGNAGNNQNQQMQPQQTGAPNGFGQSDMASVASSFTSLKVTETSNGVSGFSSSNGPGSSLSPLTSQNTAATNSTFSDTLFSSLSSQPTGATSMTSSSATPSVSVSPPLKPQTTGFTGLKQFKPSSSFGAQLLESLPSIPQSQPSTPGENGTPSASTSNLNGSSSTMFRSSIAVQSTGMNGLGSQPTGSLGGLTPFGNSGGNTVGVGLRPQMTGSAGAANPFRSTMFSATSTPTGSFNSMSPSPSLLSQPTGAPSLPTPSFGGSLLGGSSLGSFGSQPQGQPQQSQHQLQQQQQNGFTSLI